MCAHIFKEYSSAEGCDDLRNTNRAVEETEIISHVASLDGVGDDRERQGQHSRPGCANECVAKPEHVRVGDKEDRDKAESAYDQGNGISPFVARFMLEPGQNHRPEERSDRLNSEADTHPVAGSLESFVRSGSAVPAVAVGGYSSVGIGPHIHESRPAEELHETNCPESGRSFLKQGNETFLLGIGVGFGVGVNTVKLSVLLGIHLLDGSKRIETAEDKDSRSGIERPFNGIRDNTFGSRIGNTDPSKENREDIANQRAGVAEGGLDSIGSTLLLLVDHIADHHLERLHGYINRGVEEHEREKPEPHRGIQAEEGRLGEREVTCIGQE